jgi:glucosyl-dolichyl phosphate glucuronosyltransferase
MLLSVIIPTRNRAKYLKITLESIAKQTFPPAEFEVLVVDNGSTDNTREVTNSFKNEIRNLRYFYENTPGLHVGRHKGLKESISTILVYADDDIEAFPTWLEGIYESFENNDIVLVGGKNLPKFESEPPAWIKKMWNQKMEYGNVLGYLSILDFGDEIKEINPSYVYGCNFSIRKDILKAARGFHPDGMPQELIKYRGDGESYVSEYIFEKGYKAIYNPKASVYHFVLNSRMTLKYFKQRAYNQGISVSYSKIRLYSGKKIYNKIIPENRDIILQKKIKIIKLVSYIIFNIINFLKDPVTTTIKYKINEAHKNGFKYHQNEIKKDNQLFEWVMKDNYID